MTVRVLNHNCSKVFVISVFLNTNHLFFLYLKHRHFIIYYSRNDCKETKQRDEVRPGASASAPHYYCMSSKSWTFIETWSYRFTNSGDYRSIWKESHLDTFRSSKHNNRIQRGINKLWLFFLHVFWDLGVNIESPWEEAQLFRASPLSPAAL